jgi:ribosome maturation factor RimP
MDSQNTRDHIAAEARRLAQAVANELGLELFDLEYDPQGGLMRIFIDRPAGDVSIDDCGDVSGRLAAALDAGDLIPHAYRLEVSSPGLDRPLRGADDYRRFKGRLARFHLAQPVGGRNDLAGRLDELQGGMVRILLDGDESLWVPLNQVAKARLEVEIVKGKKKK